MRTTARAFFVAALAVASACDNPGVTRPTQPNTPLGTPQSLTVAASPTTIPYAGGNVHLTAAITVQPGARMPGSISVKPPQAKESSLLPITAEGRLDTYSWVTQAGEIIVRAGDLEKRIAITQSSAPPPPTSPAPTCGGGGPWPCPTPPEGPTPPPPPSIILTVTSSAATVDIYTAATFTATATAANGAMPATSYTWDFGDGSPTMTTTAPINFIPHIFNSTTLGAKTVSVTATNGTQTSIALTTVTITAPALLVSLVPTTSTPTIGASVSFTATLSSTGPLPVPLTFEWDEDGDGNYEFVQAGVMTTSSSRDVSFGTVGAHTVKVKVTDPATGRTAIASRQVTVS